MNRDSSDARNVTAEALAFDPATVTTARPYCMVMLGDAVNAKKAAGQARTAAQNEEGAGL